MATTIYGTFNNAQINSDLLLSGHLAHCVKITIFNRDSLADIVRVEFFLQARFELRAIGTRNPEWITRQQSFAEGD
jgi:hypothetical protein